jgi:hypothetical protein
MKKYPLVWAIIPCFVALSAWADLNMDWAYHSVGGDSDLRTREKVPGEAFPFMSGADGAVPSGEPVTLYVLTTRGFAGDREAEIYARWWNGDQEHWVQGHWQKNITLGDAEPTAGLFRGLPRSGSVEVDLWKIEISAELTRPGDNYYVIQLKVRDDAADVRYLLREPVGEFGGQNELGQAWTASPEGYFGHDWKVVVAE